MTKARWFAILLLVVFLLPVDGGGVIPSVTPSPTSVVYVHEKDLTAVPGAVMAGLNKLNRQGIRATVFEDDEINGMDGVPVQYQKPLEAARKSGEPCLVVLAEDAVVNVVDAPQTEQAVLEAIK